MSRSNHILGTTQYMGSKPHRLSAYAIFLIIGFLAAFSAPVSAQENLATSDTAIIHQLEGSVNLLNIGRQATTVRLNQKLRDGHILDITNKSLVEITYNNGCGEIVSNISQHKIDACACQTSPFRKGITDRFNATLKNTNGDILIFQGERYVPATENMRLGNGDRIMLMRDSTAVVSYDSGCVQNMPAFSIQTVDGCSLTCPKYALLERFPEFPLAQPTPPTPLTPTPVPAPVVPPAPIPVTPLPPVPVYVVSPELLIGIGAIALIDNEDNDRQRAVSP